MKLVKPFDFAILISVVIFMLAPLVVVVLVSLSPSSVFNLPERELSLTWYRNMVERDGIGSALALSLGVALLSTLISLLIGTMCAIGLQYGKFKAREPLLAFFASPLMMPGLVIGVALLQIFRELGLRDVFLALMVGHVIITLPYVIRTIYSSLSLFDFKLVEAAQTLGYPMFRAASSTMIPALAPAFLSSSLFAFLASMDNYPISIFLTDARNKTLPIEILSMLEESPDPTIAAISSCLILLALIALLIAGRAVGFSRLSKA